jgi:hypothetical protein
LGLIIDQFQPTNPEKQIFFECVYSLKDYLNYAVEFGKNDSPKHFGIQSEIGNDKKISPIFKRGKNKKNQKGLKNPFFMPKTNIFII